MATIRDLAKKARDDAKKNRESPENKARQERLSNATLSSNTAFTSGAKPQAELSKPAKITSDVSGEAWTRATPSQTVIPEKTVPEKTTTENKQGFLSRLTNTVKGGLKGSLATNTDAMGALYESGQNARDRQNQEYLADYKRSLDRAKRDLEAMQADNKLHPNTWSAGDLESQGYIVEDAQRKYDAMLKVVNGNVQQKAVTASRDLSAAVQESSAKDIAKAKDGLGTAGQILVDAGASLTQMAGDAAVGVATGTSGTMLPFGLRALGGGTMQARQAGADIEDQMLYGSAIAAKEILTEKMFNIALPFSKAYGGGALDDVVQSSIGKAVDKFAKTDAGKKLLGGGLTLATSALSEGAEEFIGDWLEWQLPRIYGGDVASAGETLTNSMYDFLVGAASGLMGDASGKVVSGTANGVQSQIATRQVGQAVKDATGNTQNTSLISEIQKGLAADEGSKARTLAQRAQKELDSKKTVSNKLLGKLAVENQNELRDVMKGASPEAAAKAMTELSSTGNVSTATMAELRASAKVSPAASEEVQQTEAQAQVTQAENPDVNVLDAATTLFTQQGMKLKTAQEKAGIVQKLIAGEEVSARDINKLNPTSKESQAIFTKLTGVQFPDGKVTQEQLYNLYRSAHDVAVQAQMESVAIDSVEGRGAFPGINRVLDNSGQETPVNQMSEEQILEQAKTVRETANPEADARAAQALAQMRGEIAPDGNALLSFKEFSDFIKQQNHKATREETARLYDQYLKDNQTIEYRGQRLSHMQFMDMVRNAPTGSELTEAEAESLWAAEVDRQRGAGEEKYSVSESQRTKESEMNAAAEQARRAENAATAKWMQDVLKPIGVQQVIVEYGTMGDNENAYIDSDGILHFNGDRMSGANAMIWTLGHELVHHAEFRTGETGNVSEDIIDAFSKLNKAGALSGVAKTWMDNVDGRVSELKKTYQDHEASLENGDPDKVTDAYCREELAGDLMRIAFTEDNLLMSLAGEKPSLLIRSKEALARLKAQMFGNEQIRATVDARKALDEMEKRFEKALKTSEARAIRNEPGAFTDPDGNLIVENDGKGSSRMSLSTYEESGKEILRTWLDDAVDNKQLSREDADDILNSLDTIYQVCKGYKDQYAPFSAWSDAKVVTDSNGNPVFSVVKANGDYSMNLDFSLVCKKRRTLDAVLNEMVRRGLADNVNMGQENIVRINDIIRKYGFEAACSLCFVDAKRFRQAKVADDFVKMYNDQVNSLIPKGSDLKASYFNFGGNSLIDNTGRGIESLSDTDLDFTKVDKILKTKGERTVEYKIAKHLKENAADRRLCARSDFLSTRGFNVVKKENPAVLSLFNSKKGSGGPKSAESDVQYLNEILASKTFDPEKAYAVGGVRIQSFSDFVPRMVFDYVQMFADMSAKQLPGHAYTKEELFVKMFGLTGLKINMSLIPKVVDGGVAAGLDADGNYVWADESFDYDIALEIQSADGYSKNCGTIAVGVSDEHIRKLLADPNIRMVIPYHKSGLNPEVARMNKIDQFTDYTDSQNTRHKNGNKLDKDNAADKKLLAEETNFNQRLHEMGEDGDPQAVVEEYVKWCEDNDLLPKFDQFVYKKIGDMFVEEDGHKVVDENYYKLIEDFTVYDGGAYSPQTAVKMTFPTEDSAFGSMSELIKRGLEEDAILEGMRSEKVGPIVDEIAQAMQSDEWKGAAEEPGKKRSRKRYSVAKIRGLMTEDSVKGKTDAEISDMVEKSDIGKKFSLLNADEIPKKVVIAYKAFYAHNGQLYPPMVANLTDADKKKAVSNAVSGTLKSNDTPVGLFLGADIGQIGRYKSDATQFDVAFQSFWSGKSKAVEDLKAELKASGLNPKSAEYKQMARDLAVKYKPELADYSMTELHHKKGDVVRNESKRLAVENDKGGGTLAFRPGWHLGLWPDAKQFNKNSAKYGPKSVMPDGLVFAKCIVAADVDYQLDAMELGMTEKGSFDRTQAGLPRIPVGGYYKYRTNADPTTAPWLITGSMAVLEIMDDDMTEVVCQQYGVTRSPRESDQKIDLAKYGLKAGAVNDWAASVLDAIRDYKPGETIDFEGLGLKAPAPTADQIAQYSKSQAQIDNETLLQQLLDEVPEAYVPRKLNFDDEEIQKEFARNKQDVEYYREQYLNRGGKKYSITGENDAVENEKAIRKLENEIEDINSKLDLASVDGLSETEIRRLRNQLTKNQYELDQRNAAERKAAVRTPLQTVLDNLDNYRAIDLESIANQLTDNAWDDVETLSTEELKSGIREILQERAGDMSPLELQSPKFGVYVRKPSTSAGVRYPVSDRDYMATVERGDMETAQKMVDEAAKKAGYNSPVLYHGSPSFGFTQIYTKKSNDHISFFATDSMQTAGTYSGTSTVRNIGDTSESSLGMYQFYANTDGMVEFDAKGAESNHIALGQAEKDYNDFVYGSSWYSFATAKQLAKYAKQKGYTGVIIKNVVDAANPQSRKTLSPANVYIFFSPQSQLKSADPVTYDDNGNVIPLSERFQTTSPDIRYSVSDREYMATVDRGDMETAQKMVDEAAKAAGYTVEGYHGTGNGKFNSFKYGNSGIYMTSDEEVAKTYGDKVMRLYATENNQLVVDANGHYFTSIPVPAWLAEEIDSFPLLKGKRNTDTIAMVAKQLGYSSLKIANVIDSFSTASDTRRIADDYIYFESIDKLRFKNSQVKSADPVTYDDNGNVIPLSERFQTTNPDIRYSITPEFEQWYKENFGGEDLTDAQLQRRLEYAKQKENDILVSKQAAKTKQDVDQRYKDLTAWMMYHERKMREQRQTLKDRSKAVQQSLKADKKDALEKQADIHKAELAVARDEKVKALKDQDLAWRIYSQQQTRNAAADKAEALKTARKEANAEKAEAVRTAKEVERAKAEVQHDADMMAMKREAAKRLHVKEDAYQQKAEQRKENQKLKRNAAKQALRDSKLAAKKRAEAEVKQGAVDTIRKNPASRSAVEKLQERASQLRTLGRSAYRTFVNQAMDIDQFAKRQVEGTRASTLVTVLGGANDTVSTIYKNGLVDRAGNTIGESMKDVFLCWDIKGKKVDQKKQALLQDYMLHQHNVDRMSFVDRARTRLETFEQENPWLSQMDTKEFARLVAMTDAEIQSTGKQEAHDKAVQYARLLHEYDTAQNKPIFGDSDGNAVTADTSRKIVQQYLSENPWLEEKAQGIYDWWDKFMRAWAVGDSITETEYNTMRELYPHYVPTYRADKKGVGAANFVGANGASIGKAVKKAKGGMSEVLNIEDSFSNLVSKIVRLERTNELYMNMIDSAMLDNDDTFSDMIVFDWDWQDGQYGKTLEVGALLNGDLDARYDDAESAGLSKVGQDRKLTAWHNGRQYSAYISEDLFKSIANVTGTVANDLEKNLIKLGNALTGPMKTAITGINPTFALRNVSRDLPTAITNSISGLAFPKYWAQAATEIAKNSENWQHFQALGGTNATYYNDQNGFVKSMEQRDGIGAKAVSAMGAFNEVTEAQTRFAEYLATIDRLGDTYENRLLGIKNAAEVTVDFSRKGRAGKLINAWVPYWNPAVQGVDKVVRSVIDSPDGSAVWKQAAKTVGRASMTAVLFEAILYAVLKGMGRYDDWEELDDRTKDTYYCIPYGKSNTFIKVPKNREWGAILGTPLMRMLEYANGRENPFENYIETSLEPNFLPGQILAPREGGGFQSDVIGFSQALDLQANKDFAGRTIVPYAYQQGSITQQYDENTSWFAKKLGDLLNFSPMQIDYIIKDYFGDFGDLAVSATSDAVLKGTESLPEKATDLLTGSFKTDNRYNNYTVSKYYDTLEKLEQTVQDRKNQMEGDSYQGTVEYQTKSALDKLYGKQISELNKQVRNSTDQEERDNLKGQIAELAGQALEYYQDCMDGKVENPVLDAQYANLPSAVSKELIRLDGYSKDYGIKPTGNPSAKYTDPKNKNKEYVLTDEQKDKFKEIYQEQYAQTFAKVIGSSKYKSASDEKKANLLENARDDVLEDTKDEFFKWLKKTGAKSTAKKK